MKFNHMCGTIRRILKGKVIIFYKAITVPYSLCGSGTWRLYAQTNRNEVFRHTRTWLDRLCTKNESRTAYRSNFDILSSKPQNRRQDEKVNEWSTDCKGPRHEKQGEDYLSISKNVNLCQ